MAVPASAAAGARPFRFLSGDFHARAAGMGGAYTALASDAGALRYNPAGLARIDRAEASFMHSPLAEGASQEQFGVALPAGWGLGLNYLDSGPVLRTTVSHPDGTLGETRAADVALTAGTARRFGAFSGGAAVKLIRGSVDTSQAFAAALDLGLLWSPGESGLILAAALQNMGPAARFQGDREPLPLELGLGAAYGFLIGTRRAALTLDARKAWDGAPLASAGGEVVVAGVMPVRLGVSEREAGGVGVTAGLGWLLGAGSFDYGVAPFSALGIEHRLSASVRWGEGRRKPGP